MAQTSFQSLTSGLSGLSFRNNTNTILAALFSASSGGAAPSPVVGGQFWLDSSVSPAVLRMRNLANTAWLDVVTSEYASTVGNALITASSAAAARSTLSAAPLPQSGAGVGQISNLFAAAGNPLVLPSGGTWFYFFIQRVVSNVGLNSTSAGVAAGGSTVATSSGTVDHFGFAWRLA